MPRNLEIKKILVIGSGPIIIGQACEFDYSGTQACKALREEGYKVILVNSNPATIMTDPETADEVYIEPITPTTIKKIILKEKVDAVLPTIGGQTSLNVAVKVAEEGFFKENGVVLIGADIKAIKKAEDRKLFKKAMDDLGYQMAQSEVVTNQEKALTLLEQLKFPVVIRTSFTLGGTGGAIAYNLEEYKKIIQNAFSLSSHQEIQIEQSLLGWKEFELEVMKDNADNVVIICSIENLNPMGVHTGDSITVAPQQTLSDSEYQKMRNMAIAIIRKIGVSTGGANVQFAVNPENKEILVIEMNPRVSRSSALASKATGFPIAKIAAKLAVGLRLDEIANDITQNTPACFEPTIDYVVTKIPKFAFEKFSSSSPYLGVQMKAVGETMAIGRTFKESFQKAIRGLEVSKVGFDGVIFNYKKIASLNKRELKKVLKEEKHRVKEVIKKVSANHFEQVYYIKDLFYWGYSVEEIYAWSKVDPWFLYQMKEIFDWEQKLWHKKITNYHFEEIRFLKQMGFSNEQLAIFFQQSYAEIEKYLQEKNIVPQYKIVDTCAGEFSAYTPYYYSTYDEENEFQFKDSTKERVVIIGGGPNRIGQGIEFDYMCVKAAQKLKSLGYEVIIINSNPETVSTDYDTSDYLFFEPLTKEDVLNILKQINPLGVIVHLGGQTPLNLVNDFSKNNIPILGTSINSISICEDREAFRKILNELGFLQPESETALTLKKALVIANKIGYPILVRPSYVLGGLGMKIVYDDDSLITIFEKAQKISSVKDQPILIDKFLEEGIEIDLDLVCDGESVIICGVLEHIEKVGVHSGDSASILPPQNISPAIFKKIINQAKAIAKRLNIIGLMNIQFAIKGDKLYFIEANPRGSRTVPFISKASSIPWVNLAIKAMMGEKFSVEDKKKCFSKKKMELVTVKESVFPFDKFVDEDIILGPEMKSTGEVMGVGKNLPEAFYKSQIAVSNFLPKKGGVLISISSPLREEKILIPACKKLLAMGFTIFATEGTSYFLNEHGISNKFIHKLGEGRPNIQDAILNQEINLIFNTPIGKQAKSSDAYIRLLAKQYKISVFTMLESIHLCVEAMNEYYHKKKDFAIYSLKAMQ